MSKDYKEDISIVPDTEQGEAQGALVSATDYLPHDTLLVVKDLGFVHDAIDRIYEEGFARQAQQELAPTSEMEEQAQQERLKKNSCSLRVKTSYAV